MLAKATAVYTRMKTNKGAGPVTTAFGIMDGTISIIVILPAKYLVPLLITINVKFQEIHIICGKAQHIVHNCGDSASKIHSAYI